MLLVSSLLLHSSSVPWGVGTAVLDFPTVYHTRTAIGRRNRLRVVYQACIVMNERPFLEQTANQL